MITVILFGITGIFLAIHMVYSEGYASFMEYFVSSIIGACFGVVTGIAVAFILPMDTETIRQRRNLEALQDGSATSGHFFLGCGSLNGEMKYVFYYEDQGFFQMRQVDYALVKIKYATSEPTVVFISEKPTESVINKFALDILPKVRYEIDIPNGSILKQYTLDAK